MKIFTCLASSLDNWTRLAASCLFTLLCLLCLSGCTTGRVATRLSYWTTETRDHLPVGTNLPDAERFFEVRGLHLRCCVSAEPDVPKSYFAVERDVGRLLWTQYSVSVLVRISATGQVENVRVERWGVGL
jgi:hypothetical protein